MRRLDLKDYTYSMPNQQGVMQIMTYQFKRVLINVLTHPNLGLNAPELLEANEVAEKIEKANKDVVLNEEDYELIIDTFKRFRGFAKNDVKMVQRIHNCPKIESVIEKG